MARRTYLELLIDTLKTQPGEQASAMKIAGLLGWKLEKVRKVASKAHDSPLVPVFIAKGGVIKHRGSERGASVGIYADVAQVIATYWGPREMGLRNIDVIETSRSGTRGGGVWTHPDLVVAADPAAAFQRAHPSAFPRLGR